jgi:hypothetical protein
LQKTVPDTGYLIALIAGRAAGTPKCPLSQFPVPDNGVISKL